MAKVQSSWQRMLDSFKPAETYKQSSRNDMSPLTSEAPDFKKADAASGNESWALENVESTSGTSDAEDSRYNKDLSVRHLLTLAVGGAIGTGLFVNSGSALTTGGPGSLVIDWVIISTCLFTIVNALGELSSTFPVVGLSLIHI